MTDPGELVAPVDLCRPDGALNPAAVGWSRRPVHRANLGRGGRRKRWEYWAVQSGETVLALTVSDLDYAGLAAIWFLDPQGEEHGWSDLTPWPRLAMPERAGDDAVALHTAKLSITLTPIPIGDDAPAGGMQLQASADGFDADVVVRRAPSAESLGVVVPWSRRRFQYTVKETALPASGTVTVAGRSYTFDAGDALATWDFGRGKWPYRITWNWASGAGRLPDGEVVGLQFGGQWTDGTGANENAVFIGGRCRKLAADVQWDYDPHDWSAPWHLHTPDGIVDVTLHPTHVRTDKTNVGIIANDTHQCFGTWRGRISLPHEQVRIVDGLRGWAEEVRNRW